MKTQNNFAMRGQGRLQWQSGGWAGSLIGASAWLIPTAVILAVKGQPILALLPAVCFVLMIGFGVTLWQRRDRTPPFQAFVWLLLGFSVVTPLVFFSVSTFATRLSLDALSWPAQGFTAWLAILICPAMIVLLYVIDHSGRGAPGSSVPAAQGDE